MISVLKAQEIKMSEIMLGTSHITPCFRIFKRLPVYTNIEAVTPATSYLPLLELE